MFSPAPSARDNDAAHPWRYRLDQFVKEEQQSLAALAWAFHGQWPDKEQYLGLDLQPSPHFISCDPQAIAKLNDQVNGRIQEMVGILNGYDPATEVAILAISLDCQFKLLFFQPSPSPEACYQALGLDIEQLQHQLEQNLAQRLDPNP